MADSFVQLPDDSGNAGKKVYTHTAVTADGTVHKHVFDVDSSALPTGAATEATLGTRVAESTFTGRIGEVQASPTANTVLDRLKALLTGIVLAAGTALIGKVKLRNVADTADMGDATTPVRVDPTGTTAQPVTDNAGSLTVDAPVGTPAFVRLSDGAAAYKTNTDTQLPAALVGGRLDENIGAWLGSTAPTVGQKTMVNSLPVTIASDQGAITPSSLCVTVTAAVNTAATLTLPAAGAGLFHYITMIQVTKLYSVIGVAAGAGVIITTTNLPGTPAFTTEQLASVAGTATLVVNISPATPIKSSVANTATTIVCPQQLQTIWRVNVWYFTGT